MNIYALNQNFERIALIDVYTSLIWNNSFFEAGEFELYLPAHSELLDILNVGNYIVRSDDDMIGIIEKIELETSAEDGNYLIISGHDVKIILNRRIIWETINFDGTIENYIRKIINDNIINPVDSARTFTNTDGQKCVELGAVVGYDDGIQEQCSYANVGEKIQAICEANGYGIKCILNNKKIQFNIVKGADNGVIFSDKFDNLATTKYLKDTSDIVTTALIGGEGEGAQRKKTTAGAGNSFARCEVFVDAADIASETSEDELAELYPAGAWTDDNYIVPQIDFAYDTDEQLEEIKAIFPGGEIIIKVAKSYYRCYNVLVASRETLEDDEERFIYNSDFYKIYLLTRGFEEINAHGMIETFEGDAIPDATFNYKSDYYLGDIVTVVNAYGIRAQARIVNILECFDDNGRKFEITLGG